MATHNAPSRAPSSASEHPTEYQMMEAAYVLLHTLGFAHRVRDPDHEATELLQRVVGLANDYIKGRIRRSSQTKLVRVTDAIAKMYETVDEAGNLPEPVHDGVSACLEPWLAARTQGEFFRRLFKLEGEDDAGYVRVWTLSRGAVSKRGGPTQAASLAAADFMGSSSRTYFNVKKRPDAERHELHEWLFWGQETDTACALEGVLQLLGVDGDTARRAADVAFGPR